MATKQKETRKNEDHLEWLVRCRSENQHASLRLYQSMTQHSAALKKDGILFNTAISLVAISFNLWRAVFLVDAEDRASDTLEHSISFLRTLISDNAIAYAQDRNARAWSARSYLNNARWRLMSISEDQPTILPHFDIAIPRNSKTYWEHLQSNASLALGNLTNALKRPPQSN